MARGAARIAKAKADEASASSVSGGSRLRRSLIGGEKSEAASAHAIADFDAALRPKSPLDICMVSTKATSIMMDDFTSGSAMLYRSLGNISPLIEAYFNRGADLSSDSATRLRLL